MQRRQAPRREEALQEEEGQRRRSSSVPERVTAAKQPQLQVVQAEAEVEPTPPMPPAPPAPPPQRQQQRTCSRGGWHRRSACSRGCTASRPGSEDSGDPAGAAAVVVPLPHHRMCRRGTGAVSNSHRAGQPRGLFLTALHGVYPDYSRDVPVVENGYDYDAAYIPGKANDRKNPLGELSWIFTAVTDSIASNSLPRPPLPAVLQSSFFRRRKGDAHRSWQHRQRETRE
jgi:hypothetical protein